MYANNMQGGYSMERKFDRKLVLEDGSEYLGFSFGGNADVVCELVFNTQMAGYQEVVSDPSYINQMVVMTYPLIGNYGIADDDFESKVPTVGGLVVRDYNDMPSNFRYTKTLSELMSENNIPGIYGLDTRKLARNIRDNGTKIALLTDINTSADKAKEIISNYKAPTDAVKTVSCKKRWYSRTSNHRFNVVIIDCGVKLSIIKGLNLRGCNVTVVPYNTTAEELKFLRPDGILVSNGPGNPEDVNEVIETIKAIRGEFPIFGIGLGHQLIALSYGAKTYKMKFGHHGGNHPVKNLANGKIEIAPQNHCYVVCEDSVKNTDLEITHIDILDNTVAGLSCKKDKIFSVQYHPDSIPGDGDGCYIFDEFINIMKEGQKNA